MAMPEIDQTISRYKITALLGKGGMGQVYKAHDLTLQRDVAIKVMHAQYASQKDFQERFLQEARTAARLSHPSIVQVHDFGQHRGMLYIVMELIPGSNLGILLREMRGKQQWIPLLEGVELLRQVALALDYAHNHGVLHRDMKPENIMLKPEDSGRLPYRPVITDLGLAKLAEGGLMTQEGISMGTPPYMSPEQSLGKPTDARSDVYSLGILLYELAVGKLPFDVQSLPEAIRCHTQEPPPSPRSIRPDLPPNLEAVILKALEKDRAARYPSAAEMAQALESTLDSVTKVPAPDSGLGSAISLFTQIQNSQIQPRGPSILQDFEREFGRAAGAARDMIQVMAPDTTSRAIEVNQASLIIGRGPESAIVLDDAKVSRQHARIDHTASQWTVTDLGSTNGTFLDEVQLLAGVTSDWSAEQILRIGRHWLRLVPSQQPKPQPKPGPGGGTTVAPPEDKPVSEQPQFAVAVRVGAPRVTVEPGSLVTLPVTLLNQGKLVDHFEVKIEGLRPAWVSLDRRVVQLLPGREEQVLITVRPPREPASRAGLYPFRVTASGQASGRMEGGAPAELTVLPFSRSSSEMHPEIIATGRSSRITVTNQGNQPELYTLRWRDPGDELAFHPAEVQVNVPEGQSVVTEFRVTPRRAHWIGGEKSYAFTADVLSPAGDSRGHNGEFTSRPRLTLPVIIGLLASCLALVICGVIAALVLPPGIIPVIPAAPTTAVAPVRASPTAYATQPVVILPTATQSQPTPTPTTPAPKPTATPAVGQFDGTWWTNFARIDFKQQGNQVTGSYRWYGSDTDIDIRGQLDGSVLNGTAGTRGTRIRFTLSADSSSFDGIWISTANEEYPWCGVKSGPLPDNCGFSGFWYTLSDYTPASPPTANLVQTGDQLTGTFFNGTNTGTVTGRLGAGGNGTHYVVTGEFTVNGYTDKFTWALADNRNLQFRGYWRNSEGDHEWCGWREVSSKPDPCKN